MSGRWHIKGTSIAVIIGLGACAQETTGPIPAPAYEVLAGNENADPAFEVLAANQNGAIIEVGEHNAPFGLILRDIDNQLLVYYRWDNSFCGAGAPVVTDFVLSTYRDVIRLDESWLTLDKTDDHWFYVYDWTGTPAFPGCAFLQNNTPLAVGRGRRLLHDNDFYPVGPYGPGPGANTYVVKLKGDLLTPAGQAVQFLGNEHITADAEGNVIRWDVDLRLSPDPRQSPASGSGGPVTGAAAAGRPRQRGNDRPMPPVWWCHRMHSIVPSCAISSGTRRVSAIQNQGVSTVEQTLFLCGDVMTGRGIDQILPHPGDPRIHESGVRSARAYVELAEQAHGPIPYPVDFSYVWGDALEVLDRARPQLRIINLETTVTTSDAYVPKGINYRMHPANAPVLRAARIDCCALANNHALDWGESGLLETLDVVRGVGVRTAGAGRNSAEAAAPAVLSLGEAGRVLVFAYGTADSGIPSAWAARSGHAGVNLLVKPDAAAIDALAAAVTSHRQPGDVTVLSIHWGSNWGYEIPEEHRQFAHGSIERAGIDVVFGHSSHHPRAIEVHRGRLILYGCGDFLDDYEGIGGYEEYRDDLVLMYLPTIELGTGRLVRLVMVPLQIRGMRLCAPSSTDRAWLLARLDRECRRLNARVVAGARGTFELTPS